MAVAIAPKDDFMSYPIISNPNSIHPASTYTTIAIASPKETENGVKHHDPEVPSDRDLINMFYF